MDFAQDVLLGDLAVLEHQLGLMIAHVTHGLVGLAHPEAGSALIHQESGGKTVLGIGDSEDDGKVRSVGVADKALGSVQDPFVALFHSGGFDVTRVGTGLGLGEGEALVLFAVDGGGQVTLFLLFIAGQQDGGGVGEQPVHGAGNDGGNRLDSQNLSQSAEAAAAHFLGHTDRHETGVLGLRVDLFNGFLGKTVVFLVLFLVGQQLVGGKVQG